MGSLTLRGPSAYIRITWDWQDTLENTLFDKLIRRWAVLQVLPDTVSADRSSELTLLALQSGRYL